ncbi:hypothetical protein AMECASPLE_035925 [Ameca splendens]|uniref:Uncharacterized protein n=1 Tax=Ameca splendens TaxID=208324 RepID=A0ABV0XWZ2_9TELE
MCRCLPPLLELGERGYLLGSARELAPWESILPPLVLPSPSLDTSLCQIHHTTTHVGWVAPASLECRKDLIGMRLCFGGGAGRLACLVWRGVQCGSVGGQHAGAPPGFGCGVGRVPSPWRAVVAFLQCLLLWLWPLAGRQDAVGGRVVGAV